MINFIKAVFITIAGILGGALEDDRNEDGSERETRAKSPHLNLGVRGKSGRPGGEIR